MKTRIVPAIALLVVMMGCGNKKSLDGRWQGSLQAGPATLHIVFNIAKQSDGTYTATLDSPDQKASGIQVDKVTQQDDNIHFEVASIGGAFDGKWNSDGTAIEGQWKQGPVTLPLTLQRTAESQQK